MTAREKLEAKIASHSTEMLQRLAIHAAKIAPTAESALVAAAINNELERRMPEGDFVAFMELLEATSDTAQASA